MNFICAPIGFFVWSCSTPDPTPAAARFCQTATLVRYSSKDTPETRRQLRAANAKWRAVCASPVAAQ